jgi:ParB family chromosome partitioning protein
MNEERMKLPKITIDDLFTTQEERDNKNMERIIEIPIKEITDFPNHPYKVIDNEQMKELSESIKENGLFTPVIVRTKKNGGYEMISGHRRKRATELAGISKIKAIVKDLTDDEAIILMVDSNQNQREEALPSEKAFAYKMKMEVLKRQGKRNDLTSCPVDTKSRTDEIMSEELGESARNIQRYIRLTELIPKILQMVDEKQIAFRPAVEISFLTRKEQRWLLDSMRYNDSTPSLAQTIRMKQKSKEGVLNEDEIELIMSEEKPNQIEKFKIDKDKIQRVLPKQNMTQKEIETLIITCIEEHNQRIKKQRQRDER